jgi:hypothetical protein
MKRTLLIILIALLFAVGGFVAYRILTRPQMVVGGDSDVARVSLDAVDHSGYDALLQKYVSSKGLVAYTKWKATPADVQALDAYLASLAAVDLSQPASRPAELAYWLNAYNALTLKGVLGVYPTDSIRNHASALKYDPRLTVNLWYDLYLQAGDRKVNLTEIEHRILRLRGDPRVHFGLVCASRGCPPLWNHAFTSENVDQALDDIARRFFTSEDNFQAYPETRTVALTELFKWYAEDFGKTPAEQLHKLRPYLPDTETLGWIEDGPVKIEYLQYDWYINDQGP